ncbi:MAG: DUF58 domain-containing protein [Micrococcales bacterium]|nr:DUF58 domain-containing protein [Micrococcales bacterium]
MRGWQLKPTWRGVCLAGLALASLLVAIIFKRRDLLFVSSALVLVVVLGFAGLLMRRRPERLIRQAPLTPVAAGSRLPILLRPARSRLPREPVFDLGPWNAAPADPTGTDLLVYWLRFARRGVVPVGPAVVQRIAPLGLARLTIEIAPVETVLVSPTLIAVPVEPPRFDVVEHSSQISGTGLKEVDPGAVRPYQSGDPRTKVHWRATARRGRLMVRQDRPQPSTDVWLVLDNGLATENLANPAPGADPLVDSFELAVSAAASLSLKLMRLGHAVHLLTTDGRSYGPFRQSGGRDPVLNCFARLEAGSTLADWPGILAGAMPVRGGQVPVYLLLFHQHGPSRKQLVQIRQMAEPAEALLMPKAASMLRLLQQGGWQVNLLRQVDS